VVLACLPLISAAAGAAEPIVGQADLVASLLPTVVNISTIRYAQAAPGQPPTARRTSLGSGFIIDPSGIIATNAHVVSGANEISVTLSDNTLLAARELSHSAAVDIALLQVTLPRPLPAVRWGDSNLARPGDPVLAIGNPLGFGGSVTAGIISALDRDIRASRYDDFIQTDAAINPGNSGGPLFNLAGEVIGVNTALFETTDAGGSIGIGFATPSNQARFVIERLRQFGRVRPGWVGVQAQQVTAAIAQAAGLPQAEGAIVTGFDDGSTARRAGLEEGDIILKFDYWDITNVRTLNRVIALQPIGQAVPVTVWRDGATITLAVGIEDSPAELRAEQGVSAAQAQLAPAPPFDPSLGLSLGPLTDAARAQHKLGPQQPGVLVTAVAAGSRAAGQGILAGDVIVRVGRDPVASPAELWQRIETARQQRRVRLLLLVEGTSGAHWAALRVGPLPTPG
jgi:serine protease Do